MLDAERLCEIFYQGFFTQGDMSDSDEQTERSVIDCSPFILLYSSTTHFADLFHLCITQPRRDEI